MKRMLTAITAALVLIYGVSVPAHAANASPGYLTIMFGRSIEQPVSPSCKPYSGTVTLLQVAQAMKSYGLTATTAPVLDQTAPSSETCVKEDAYTSWDEIATLVNTYGWSVVSAGENHTPITQDPTSEQQSEACGSLSEFSSHGYSAAGLFDYPDNFSSSSIQQNVVSTCFDWGRSYGNGVNTQASTSSPFFQSTKSITGGSCEAQGLSCSNLVPDRTYTSPATIENLLNPAAGTWNVVQMYRFVTGQGSEGAGFVWNCNGPVDTHYTSRPETYCWNDFAPLLADVAPSTVVTSPAAVATAWGRKP
jgi:hypothetical protein